MSRRLVARWDIATTVSIALFIGFLLVGGCPLLIPQRFGDAEADEE
jgi:hypothetical protein